MNSDILEVKLKRQSIRAGLLILFISIIINYATPAQAQELQEELTLDECLDIALTYNQEIKAKNEAIYIARAQLNEAESGMYYPSFDITAGYQYTYSYPENEFMKLPEYGVPSVGVELGYPIYTGGAQSAGIDIAEINLEIALIDQDKKVKEVTFKIKEAFLGVVVSKEALDVTEYSYELSQEMYENLRTNYEAGLISEFDLNRTATAYQMAEIELRSSRQALILAKNNVFMQMGYPLITSQESESYDILFIGDFDLEPVNITMEEAIEEALAEHPDIKIMNLNKEIIEANGDLAESELYPMITAFASGTIQWTQNAEFGGTPPNISITQSDYQDNGSVVAGLEIRYSLDQLIFPTNSAYSKMEAVEYQLNQMEFNIQGLKDGIQMGVVTNYLSMEKAQSNLETSRQILDLAESNLEMARNRYDLGMIDYLNYKDVELQYFQSRLSNLNEQYNYTISKHKLFYSMGR